MWPMCRCREVGKGGGTHREGGNRDGGKRANEMGQYYYFFLLGSTGLGMVAMF